MSKNFYAYQYDMPFKPTYLKNWEVPKFNCTKPKRRTGSTIIISNIRGHLLPGIAKCANPFGTYAGTWELPKKMSKEMAFKLNGLIDKGKSITRCIPAEITMEESTNEKKKEIEIKEEMEIKEDEKERINVENENDVLCPIHNVYVLKKN